MEHPPLPIGNLRMGEFSVGMLLNKVFGVTPSPIPQLGCFVYETFVVKSVIYLLDRNNPRAVLPKLGWVCSGLGFFFHLHVCYMRIYIGFLTLLGSFSLVCCCYKLKKKIDRLYAGSIQHHHKNQGKKLHFAKIDVGVDA